VPAAAVAVMVLTLAALAGTVVSILVESTAVIAAVALASQGTAVVATVACLSAGTASTKVVADCTTCTRDADATEGRLVGLTAPKVAGPCQRLPLEVEQGEEGWKPRLPHGWKGQEQEERRSWEVQLAQPRGPSRKRPAEQGEAVVAGPLAAAQQSTRESTAPRSGTATGSWFGRTAPSTQGSGRMTNRPRQTKPQQLSHRSEWRTQLIRRRRSVAEQQ
jgi:hypothetical protein